MSKSDEAFEREVDAVGIPMPSSYRIVAKSYWDRAIAYKEEQDLMTVAVVKRNISFAAAPYIKGEILCDEIARRIKTPLASER